MIFNNHTMSFEPLTYLEDFDQEKWDKKWHPERFREKQVEVIDMYRVDPITKERTYYKFDKNYTLMDKINSFVNDRNDEVCGFLTNISHKVIDTLFAYTNISDISHFNNGLVIATSLDGADVMNKTSVHSDKCFYIWQMDWISQPFNFYGVHHILSNPNIKKY